MKYEQNQIFLICAPLGNEENFQLVYYYMSVFIVFKYHQLYYLYVYNVGKRIKYKSLKHIEKYICILIKKIKESPN